MKTDLIITDDFYSNPDETRAWALSQPFDVTGNFPGQRTEPVHHWAELKPAIQSIVQSAGGNITKWDFDYTTSFQYTTEADESWIHSDYNNTWAAVCYLTPDAPIAGGTGLFRHKETGFDKPPKLADGSYDESQMVQTNNDSRDYSKWEMTGMVGNVYNRLVMYRGDIFHRSLDYFGKDKHDGRLFQLFFFNTEH
jgi:hypothetical protein